MPFTAVNPGMAEMLVADVEEAVSSNEALTASPLVGLLP
jgi:hypothetical protein